MTAAETRLNPGGIDLRTVDKNFQLDNHGVGIKFHLDRAMLRQLQDAPGFVAVVTRMQPLKSLSGFLGLNR